MPCGCYDPVTFGHQAKWCPRSMRYALDDEECYQRVERDADQCARIWTNAAAHGVFVEVVEGAMPEALAGLRTPDAVFVGGGGPAALEEALKAQPSRVVAAVAAIERAGEMLELLDRQGFSAEGSQVGAARLTPLPGGGHRLAAVNPVFVLWGERS